MHGEGLQWSRNGTGTAAKSTGTGRTHLHYRQKQLAQLDSIGIMLGVLFLENIDKKAEKSCPIYIVIFFYSAG